MNTLQDRILDAALPNVSFDGWTLGTLERAAESIGLSAFDARRAFPRRRHRCADALYQRLDAQMLAQLITLDLPAMKVRARIHTAVMVRLRLMLPHREAVRRAVANFAMPWHAGDALKSLYRTTDAMWAAAGDTATDYNFYTKRLLLGKVYTSTLTVWLDDMTGDLRETEAFLARRIENVMQFEKLKAKARERFGKLEQWLPGFARKTSQ